MDSNISKFIFTVFGESFRLMNPVLTNYSEFSKILSKKIQTRKGGNIQYSFDVELDKIFRKNIDGFGISGRIFSEESGFYEFGSKKYRAVYDPFCNSSLASKTFLEAAAGISIFGYDYRFLTSAILDYQTGIVAVVEDGKTNFYQIQTKEKIEFNNPQKKSLENSLVIITLENQEERKYIVKAKQILEASGRILISSGHIYWLRLAAGLIDGYLDPFGGEKLYEMFACTLAQKAGCTVTNLKGEEFDSEQYLKIFEGDPDFIYYPLAARNKRLHALLLGSLKSPKT